ncbi:phosphatidylserine decarboxylase-domain-containing protein, partial [Coniella lustricola]
HPSLAALNNLVSESPYLSQLSNAMFTEALAHNCTHDPTHQPAIPSFAAFLKALNLVIRHSPPFYYMAGDTIAMGEIGLPINAMLNWPMGTLSGLKFFADARVNGVLREVLDSWGGYLASSASRETMGLWMGQRAKQIMAEVATLEMKGGVDKEKNEKPDRPSFEQLYVCPDVEDKYLGFASWDAFFTREFRPGVRPIQVPDDDDFDSVINNSNNNNNNHDSTLTILNACEAAPYRIGHSVQLHDKYWLKGQPYSLADMLGGSSACAFFAGGTVYQAFLGALSYHRWHAPVSGVVEAIEHIPGTYFSMNYHHGLAADGTSEDDGPDPNSANRSMAHLTAVATRTVIYIRAATPLLGLVALVFVGMAEVSSCEVSVSVGQRVHKGEQMGMFHYGGSTYCLVLQPSVRVKFLLP